MNPYEVLEIPPGAPPEEIKAAYHRMAKQWHPDRFSGDAKADAERRFRLLAEAFSMLKDVARQEAPAPPEPPGSPFVPHAGGAGAEKPLPPPAQIQLDQVEDRPPQAKTAEDWFKDAKTAYDGKAHGRALALILYALRMEPERGEYHAFHGKILDVTSGDARTKVRALETAIRLNPKDVDSMIILASTFQNLGMQARATRLWETVRNQAPNHAIFNQPVKGSGGKGPKAKEQIQGLGEQVSALVAEARLALGKLFKRG